GMSRDLLRAGREDGLWARRVATEVIARANADPVLVPQTPEDVNPVFHWQLGRLGQQVSWQSPIDLQRASRDCSSLWVFSYGGPYADEQAQLQRLLEDSGRSWYCAERKEALVAYRRASEGVEHCRLYHWVCEPR